MRRVIATGATIALIALSACAPIPKVVDTPKDGDQIALSVDQPMQVRWANDRPDKGAWVLEKGPTTPAVSAKGRVVKPAATPGGQQLEVFDFAGARKGSDRLTFLYKHADGAPSTMDERITIDLTVG